MVMVMALVGPYVLRPFFAPHGAAHRGAEQFEQFAASHSSQLVRFGTNYRKYDLRAGRSAFDSLLCVHYSSFKDRTRVERSHTSYKLHDKYRTLHYTPDRSASSTLSDSPRVPTGPRRASRGREPPRATATGALSRSASWRSAETREKSKSRLALRERSAAACCPA